MVNSHIILGPRPTPHALKAHSIPANTILTLLKEAENPNLIRIAAMAGSYKWVWWPLDARPHSTQMSSVGRFINAGYKIEEALKDGAVYVHCAAGIHRTGMACYAYYRIVEQQSAEDARASVVSHRSVIGTDAKEKLDWLEEQLAATKLVYQEAF